MSNHFRAKINPLRFDPAAALAAKGFDIGDLKSLGPQLEAARDEILADAGEQLAWLDQPDRLLADYRRRRAASELGQILGAAKRLRAAADRVIVLGDRSVCAGSRALFEACCHPYHNEQSRGERGSKPRLYFDGDHFDNDASQGLLDLLAHQPPPGVAGQWAIVVANPRDALETTVALRIYRAALGAAVGHDPLQVAERIVPVAAESGPFWELAGTLGRSDSFMIPAAIESRFSLFTAACLLPASLVGIDIVHLITAAAAMHEHFRAAPAGANLVLQLAGCGRLLRPTVAVGGGKLTTQNKCLDAVARWYENLGGAAPGSRESNSLAIRLIVGEVRRDRLRIGRLPRDPDRLNALAEKTLPELSAVALESAKRDFAHSIAELHLPRVDEGSLGQLFQLLMLVTTIQTRLGSPTK